MSANEESDSPTLAARGAATRSRIVNAAADLIYAKAALRSLVRSLTAELASRRIRVNSIAPGPTETPIHDKMGVPREMVEAMMHTLLTKVPAARYAQPEEIARVALFLACSDSSYVFGHEIVADGGWVAV
jgi:NAD(P)-dependent dehydrogenase (short-subunit alcohol dehydrogenase family)